MGFVTRRVPACGGVRRIVKLVLGGRPGSGSLDSVSSEHTMGRALPYLAAIAAVGAASLGLGGLAWVLGIPRGETFLLGFVLLVGVIAWRLGRGPAGLGNPPAPPHPPLLFFSPARKLVLRIPTA